MVALRPHHLLCMLTFIGRGYSAGFVANLTAIVERLQRGEAIVLTDGPDDICTPLLFDQDAHCRSGGVTIRDAHARQALAERFALDMAPGARVGLDPDLLGRMRDAFRTGASRRACTGCEWENLCTTIAETGFEASKLNHRPI
jgi:hypothetical protein